jgi:hypothetical protein
MVQGKQQKGRDKNLSLFRFVRRRSHIDRTGLELGPPNWESVTCATANSVCLKLNWVYRDRIVIHATSEIND